MLVCCTHTVGSTTSKSSVASFSGLVSVGVNVGVALGVIWGMNGICTRTSPGVAVVGTQGMGVRVAAGGKGGRVAVGGSGVSVSSGSNLGKVGGCQFGGCGLGVGVSVSSGSNLGRGSSTVFMGRAAAAVAVLAALVFRAFAFAVDVLLARRVAVEFLALASSVFLALAAAVLRALASWVLRAFASCVACWFCVTPRLRASLALCVARRLLSLA